MSAFCHLIWVIYGTIGTNLVVFADELSPWCHGRDVPTTHHLYSVGIYVR